MGQFGDKFRKAREKKGISLDDASNVTKIGSRMLQAIEEEHFDQLPGGVFNKGFIRAYAKHLGINDQEAVSEYLECLSEEQVRAQAVWEPQVRPPAPEKRAATATMARPAKPQIVARGLARGEELPELQLPKAEHVRPPHQKYLGRRENDGGIPWRLIVATVVVFVLVFILWRRHSIGNAASPVAASVPVAEHSTSVPSAGSSPAGNSPGPNAGTTTNAAVPATAPALSSSPSGTATTAKTSTSAPDSSDNDVTVRSGANAAIAASTKPVPTLTLVIRATENSWISVQADGQSVSSENLIAPAHASVRASREIVAKVGNAAGVVFLWNGKEIPADGAESEVKTFIFDAEGMRVVPNSPVSQSQ